MAQFASASFTGTSGTALTTADTNWTKHPTASAANVVISNAGRARQSATNGGGTLYTHNGAPASADYTVSATLFTKEANGGDSNGVGVTGRTDASQHTLYRAAYTGLTTDAWQLHKWVNGTATQLGSNSAQSLTDETGYAVELRMVG